MRKPFTHARYNKRVPRAFSAPRRILKYRMDKLGIIVTEGTEL
jgi:hypothetical protein